MVNLDVIPIVTRIIKESKNADVVEQGTKGSRRVE